MKDFIADIRQPNNNEITGNDVRRQKLNDLLNGIMPGDYVFALPYSAREYAYLDGKLPIPTQQKAYELKLSNNKKRRVAIRDQEGNFICTDDFEFKNIYAVKNKRNTPPPAPQNIVEVEREM